MKKAKDTKGQVRQAKRSALAESASYVTWIAELKSRYRATQIKAAVAVNSALIEFYWTIGRDVTERYSEANLGNEFYRKMSLDLKDGNEEAKGLSPQTLKYCGYFYRLYAISAGGQQVVDLGMMQQVVAQLVLVPWGHHVQIIDKCKGDRDKALFYVRRTIQNGWSRNSLLNWLSTDLYERGRECCQCDNVVSNQFQFSIRAVRDGFGYWQHYYTLGKMTFSQLRRNLPNAMPMLKSRWRR